MRRIIFLAALVSVRLQAADAGLVGSKVCAKCHAAIYEKYSITPMALSSGVVPGGIVTDEGSFSGNSGYEYSVLVRNQKLLLAFQKQNTKTVESRELPYFVGSGALARSFLIAVDGFLYEAPATYYARPHAWALSPGYDRYTYPFLTRAIAPACVQCHATGVRPIPATQNGYQSPPFLEGGVGCEKCHGAGARHAASGKARDIVNPVSLPPPQRDSVCAQCHLSGEIRVDRAGKFMSDFKPGERLSDYAVAFVRSTSTPGMKVTSHVENLAQSACARASGDRLWCGSCHDPHFVPPAAQKAAWYRSKCQTCHAASVCQRGENCAACHMPASPVSDADHVVYTDHSIPRRPAPRNERPQADAPLVPFGGAEATDRDRGLAYAIVALREQNEVYSARAFDLLRAAQQRQPDDPQTLSYLADLYKTGKGNAHRDDSTAAAFYARLYSADPTQSSAPMNLGAYQMEQGHYPEAIRLFQETLRISPGLVLVRLNLAVALIHIGRKTEARSVLEKALELNPSFTAARKLLDQIR